MLSDSRLYLEDLPIGAVLPFGSFTLTRDEIIDFASRFDPQPFHLDEAAGAASYFGGLVASGLHTQAVSIGLMVRALANVAVVAGGALHEARFYVPVRPDSRHEISGRWTEARPSSRNPERGVARIAGEARGPSGTVAMTFGVTYIVERRPAGAVRR